MTSEKKSLQMTREREIITMIKTIKHEDDRKYKIELKFAQIN